MEPIDEADGFQVPLSTAADRPSLPQAMAIATSILDQRAWRTWPRGPASPRESASPGRKKGNSGTGHGNRYLARVLGEAAVGASRTHTFLGERYRRIARRRGSKRAIAAVGRSILVIIWQLLSDENARFVDLGSGYYDSRVNLNRKMRNHVRELQNLGYRVTLEPAA